MPTSKAFKSTATCFDHYQIIIREFMRSLLKSLQNAHLTKPNITYSVYTVCYAAASPHINIHILIQ
jgi:hypothetical protein